ncbi:hypothetical protein H8B09_21645 [Paenibacillus sp. PR3]|uniref:Uncharacterized protein n=1 Tax=Paenibacillus terricola TaxID=2763503 RepID=A0ABR8MZL1_9BACL|nr:hypothetical protein [Paenibacillus terricola]MBD3921388.1 hypothetical protein [Paenibacillus terricola]
MNHRSMNAQPNDSQVRIPRDIIIRYVVSAHLGISSIRENRENLERVIPMISDLQHNAATKKHLFALQEVPFV